MRVLKKIALVIGGIGALIALAIYEDNVTKTEREIALNFVESLRK